MQLPDPLPARLKAIQFVFPAIALVMLVSAWAAFDDALLYGHETVSDAEYEAADDRTQTVYYIEIASYIAGAIAFLRWLRPTYKYLDAVAPGARRYDPGWATLGWIVPVMWWWRPKQVVNDVWRAGGQSTNAPVLRVWWVLWVASSFVTLSINIVTDDAQTASYIYAISYVGDAVCALLAIAVATQATRKLHSA